MAPPGQAPRMNPVPLVISILSIAVAGLAMFRSVRAEERAEALEQQLTGFAAKNRPVRTVRQTEPRLERRLQVLEYILETDGANLPDNKEKRICLDTRLAAWAAAFAGTDEEAYGRMRARYWARRVGGSLVENPEIWVDAAFHDAGSGAGAARNAEAK